MTFRALLIAVLIGIAIIIAIVYPILLEMQHVEIMRQQRIMDHSDQVREQCGLTWPRREERYRACVAGALRTDI